MRLSPPLRTPSVDLQLEAFALQFEPSLQRLLVSPGPKALVDAMRSAVLGRGKRFRPFLVAVCFDLFNGDPEQALAVGSAVELVHAASLVLDDLPSMDAADLRRAEPALHLRVGEATAVLAAMSLVLEAFQSIASMSIDSHVQRQLLQRFAQSCGSAGLSGGQLNDLNGLAGEESGAHKTASLMGFCCEAAAIITGQDTKTAALLRDFGECLGRLYQDRDDELDEGVTAAGKNSDVARAHGILQILPAPAHGSMAQLLHELPEWILERAA